MSEKKVMFTSGEMLTSIFDVQGSDLTHTKKTPKKTTTLTLLNRNKNKISFT